MIPEYMLIFGLSIVTVFFIGIILDLIEYSNEKKIKRIFNNFRDTHHLFYQENYNVLDELEKKIKNEFQYGKT